jgi:hypothetical protein
LEATNAASNDELARERDARVTIRSELKGKISALNSTIERLTYEVSTTQNENSELQRTKTALQNELRASAIRLSKQITTANNTAAKLKTEIHDVRNHLSVVEESKTAADERVLLLQHQHNILRNIVLEYADPAAILLNHQPEYNILYRELAVSLFEGNEKSNFAVLTAIINHGITDDGFEDWVPSNIHNSPFDYPPHFIRWLQVWKLIYERNMDLVPPQVLDWMDNGLSLMEVATKLLYEMPEGECKMWVQLTVDGIETYAWRYGEFIAWVEGENFEGVHYTEVIKDARGEIWAQVGEKRVCFSINMEFCMG